MKKSWRASESNTSLVWTHWREEREKGFEEDIAIIVNPNPVGKFTTKIALQQNSVNFSCTL